MNAENFQSDNTYELKRRKCAKMLIWACFIVYVFAMGTKNIFTAEIVVLQEVFETTKAQTSLAMTYFFITYAIMQVILSFFMARINLRIYLTLTVIVSAIITILLGVAPPIAGAFIDAFDGVKGYSMLFVAMTGVVLLFIITLVCYSIWFNVNRKKQMKS